MRSFPGSSLISGLLAVGLMATVIAALMAIVMATGSIASAQDATTKYVRFTHDGQTGFGILNGTSIATLDGDPIAGAKPTGQTVALDSVRLLPPADASKVFAVGMNFASHISSASDRPPPLFLKLPTSLTGSGSDVELPPDANNVHFEGELVLVIGKQAKNVSEADALDYVFGLTAGNNLTERSRQGRDLQWMRAKAADGFGPAGPALVTGLDPNNILLTTRLNGEIVQQENTRNMIHKPAKVVSYLSRYFTLNPGDMIFMGTPGRTSALDNGDVVMVTIEGIGTLSNRIVRPGG
jgi:2-keto-4-pentenoate hydratase/2-oxohepta-3-ene-1,7-dioic acid hydratase in catechol pathway